MISIGKLGDIIKFGKYDWLILDSQSNKMLVITNNIIKKRRYNEETPSKITTWENSEIRSYLNGEFLDSFDKMDSDRIKETELINNPNPWFGTKGCENTTDKIFLLSIEEVVKYFGDSGQLAERPGNAWEISDKYDSTRIARNFKGSRSWWWLRSPGFSSFVAASVFPSGKLDLGGDHLFWVESGGVRPALWLTLE